MKPTTLGCQSGRAGLPDRNRPWLTALGTGRTLTPMLLALRDQVLRIALRPVDVVLRLIGPSYTLFIWLFRVVPASMIAWLGRVRAVRACNAAYRNVPAYRSFLESSRVTASDRARLAIPPTDKENYIKAYRFDHRCVGGAIPTHDVAIDESSGSTGTPYNWIRSLRERQTSHLFVSHFARYTFGTEPWITINAFSMGAWATGVNMGIALQRNSMVKNTGPDLNKIFGTLEYFGPGYRYLVCGYPPFLKHLIDSARDRGFPLEQFHLMALLGGEGNSEGLRDYLATHFRKIYSGYGATDIEIGIAGETPISLAIRRTARRNPALRESLFGAASRLPMVFQYNPLMHHIVTNEIGELMFTISRLNILSPRIMYNIHDEGGVATWADMVDRARRAGVALGDLVAPPENRPVPLPFLWVYGRKDSTVSVMGANIYPEDLEQCLYEEVELARVTHSFCLGLHEGDGGATRPRLSFEVTAAITPELQALFELRMTQRLVTLNADFREAMSEFAASATPVIELFSVGTGPFSADSGRIKQARMSARRADTP